MEQASQFQRLYMPVYLNESRVCILLQNLLPCTWIWSLPLITTLFFHNGATELPLSASLLSSTPRLFTRGILDFFVRDTRPSSHALRQSSSPENADALALPNQDLLIFFSQKDNFPTPHDQLFVMAFSGSYYIMAIHFIHPKTDAETPYLGSQDNAS